MKNIKEHPISSALGVFLFILGTVLLIANYFYDVKSPIPVYVPFGLLVFGVLLLFAKDRLIDVLLLGIPSLIDKFKK